VTRWLMTIEFRFQPPPELVQPPFEEIHLDPLTGQNEAVGAFPSMGGVDTLTADSRAGLQFTGLPAGWERTPRNASCPCGSGRKFKHCHGALV